MRGETLELDAGSECPPPKANHRSRRAWRALALGACGWLAAACGTDARTPPRPAPPILVSAPPSNPLPSPTPPPECVSGALISAHRICGLGVAGRAYRWNDPRVGAYATRRAARSLAGMLRSVVTSAMVVEQTLERTWTHTELYVEIDDELVDALAERAEAEVWFDVDGRGPFGVPERTYACACVDAASVGLRIDAEQASRHALARQYSVNEVPEWVAHPKLQNAALRCAVGYVEPAFFPEDLHRPLTESVIGELAAYSRSWILSQFEDRTLCRPNEPACRQEIESLLQAANEGVSRGVALTAVWFDREGIGPARRRGSAYGWGCVFEAEALARARAGLMSLVQR